MRSASIILVLLALAPPSAAFAAGPSTNPADAPAGRYVLDQRHTSVTASVLHFGLSNFTMRIVGVSGAFDYDPARPTASRVSVTLDAHSLDAGDPAVGKQFAGEFLDADK